MQCPAILGNGVRTNKLFCEIPIGTGPRDGLRLSIPPHAGPATLHFVLHNRHALTADAGKDAAPGAGFAKYTATVRLVGPAGQVLGHAVVQSEVRTAADAVERIAGAGAPGAVKPVAPVGSEPIVLQIPADVTEVSVIGEKLSIERLGAATQGPPGQPIAIVSDVTVEYRPIGKSNGRPRP